MKFYSKMVTLHFVVLVTVTLTVYAHNHKHRLVREDHNKHRGLEEPKQPVAISPAGEFRGGYNVTRRGRTFETYRGIFYAEPPVGPLRFQPPKSILEYEGPVDATRDGPSCPRPTSPGYPVDENCLTINVYTPLKKNRSKPLPVIVYIHGGGFYTLSGRSDVAGPHYLLDHDLVLVTINYRLGSLGFLSTGDELAPGNNGFKDQVAALKWVQNNIAAFGGDPNSVTISGCSAGATSVMLHMISPMSKGLFHRAISISGSPFYIAPVQHDLYGLAVKQAQLVNCPTDNSKVIVDCLKTKPWRDLGNSLLGFYEFGFDPVSIWVPVVEKDFGQERFLTMDPAEAVREGKMHAVPHIISQTKDEFFWKAFTILNNKTLTDTMNSEWDRVAPISFQLPRNESNEKPRRLRTAYLHDRPIRNNSESARNLGLLYGDAVEAYRVHIMANLMCRHSPHPVWYYELSYIGNHSHYEDPVTKKPVGAAHHDDLISLFTLNYRFLDISTEGRDSVLVDRMTAIWYNFAKNGDPNPRDDLPELEGLEWPKMTPTNRKYLKIANSFSVHKNLKEDRLRVWEELYPIQY